VNQPTDKLGRPFAFGQLVGYPVRRGSKCELKFAEITVVRSDGSLTATNERGRSVRLRKLSEVIVVLEPSHEFEPQAPAFDLSRHLN